MSALTSSAFFGLALTILAYWVGTIVYQKTRFVLCNALIVAVVLIAVVLIVLDIPYEEYYAGGSIINMLLIPATACLAVTIYDRLELLKKNWLPILVGCAVGVCVSMGSISLMCHLFGLDGELTASMLPKSVTTPIAVAISDAHGGIPSVTVAAVSVTGILGNLIAPYLVKIFHIKNPVAAGLGIGACSHAMGTSRALEMGETEGAMSSIAIGLCGIITALASMFL